jgi:ABC-type dipeptide/oligopeptide/nickel transport system permease subunit
MTAGQLTRGGVARPRVRMPLRGNAVLIVSAAMIVVAALVAVFAPLLAPHDPNAINAADRLQSPSWSHPFGTDPLGRDQLSRVIVGTRSSVGVAVTVTSLAMAIGFPLGLVAGYRRGWFDSVVGRLLDIVLSFPGLLLALAVTTVMRAGVKTVVIALTIIYIPIVTRFVRSAVLAEREREYVVSARVAGASTRRILLEHIVPNIVSPLLVLGTSIMAFTVLAEAALSYLGFGIQPPTPSWGKMLSENAGYLSTATYLVVFPGLAISYLVLAFNLLGDALRDRLDPRQAGLVEEAGVTT